MRKGKDGPPTLSLSLKLRRSKKATVDERARGRKSEMRGEGRKSEDNDRDQKKSGYKTKSQETGDQRPESFHLRHHLRIIYTIS